MRRLSSHAYVPQLADFRRSVIHADVNDYNVLVDPARQTLTGIVDFGDAMYTHTVNDVAIAMAYIALGADDPGCGRRCGGRIPRRHAAHHG